MIDMLKNPDTWVYSLLSWLCVILSILSKDTEQVLYVIGAACLYGIQVIIWRLDDCNKNKD